MARLVNAGLSDVIDMRNPSQQERNASSFAHHPTVMLHTFQPERTQMTSENQVPSECVGDDYIKLVQSHGKYYLRILETLSEAKGMSVIHCTVGKDRTGVMIAMLLLLLGVDERDVIADYQISETYLKPRFDEDLRHHPEIPRYMLSSDGFVTSIQL